jgi:hypothetical protein
MGLYKAEQPVIPKEAVRPALMIVSSTNTFEPYALAQDASNPASHPTVYRGKRPFVAMFEVLKPSPKGVIHLFDDRCQALAIAAPGLGADGVFELLETLPSRPARAFLKVISQKVKPLSGHCEIHNSRLPRMQGESSFKGQSLHCRQGLFRFFPAAARDHKVSSPGDSHPQALSEPDVNLSAHPAPITQPSVKSPSASGRKAEARVVRFCPASIPPSYDGD